MNRALSLEAGTATPSNLPASWASSARSTPASPAPPELGRVPVPATTPVFDSWTSTLGRSKSTRRRDGASRRDRRFTVLFAAGTVKFLGESFYSSAVDDFELLCTFVR